MTAIKSHLQPLDWKYMYYFGVWLGSSKVRSYQQKKQLSTAQCLLGCLVTASITCLVVCWLLKTWTLSTINQWYFCKGYRSGALLCFLLEIAQPLGYSNILVNFGRAGVPTSSSTLAKITSSQLIYKIRSLRSRQHSFQLYFLIV